MCSQGATTSHIQAWIGPSIGVDHFEVGPEVAERFQPQHVLPPDPPARPRPHVDLAAAIGEQLQRAGIEGNNVRRSNHCTFAQPDLYWSYRRDQGICGRHLAYLTAAPVTLLRVTFPGPPPRPTPYCRP